MKKTGMHRCPVCGSEMGEGQKSCLLCGSPLASPKSHKLSGARATKRSIFLTAIGAVAGVCILFLCVFIFQGAHEQVQASNAASTQSARETNGKATRTLGNSQGVLAAGGYTCDYEGGLFIALSDGVYYQKSLQDDIEASKICDGSYCSLIANQGNLYALKKNSGDGLIATGDSIVKIDISQSIQAPEKINPISVSSAQVQGGIRFTSLCSVKGTMFCLLKKDVTHYKVLSIKDNDSLQIQELYAFEGESPKLLCDISGKLSLIKNDASTGWSLLQSSDDLSSWNVILKDSNALVASCLIGSNFYYTTKEGSGTSCIKKSTLTGAFDEFATSGKAKNLAGNEDVLVAQTIEGKIGWLNLKSGIWHMVEDQSLQTKSEAKISVYKTWLVVIQDNQAFAQNIEVSQEKVIVGSS